MGCCKLNDSCIYQIDAENCICNMIKNYNLDGAKKVFKEQFKIYELDNIGNGFIIRSIKNHLICFTASLTRMLSSNYELSISLKHLCNKFIATIEKSDDFSELIKLGNVIIDEIGYEFFKYNEPFENALLLEAVKFIKNNLSSNLTLELVAKEIHISKNYLSSIFVKIHNCKFKTYINNLRIKMAIELINSNKYSFSEIAVMCGFKNQYYFSSVFKKVMKCTALTYKKQHKLTYR